MHFAASTGLHFPSQAVGRKAAAGYMREVGDMVAEVDDTVVELAVAADSIPAADNNSAGTAVPEVVEGKEAAGDKEMASAAPPGLMECHNCRRTFH